MVNELFRLSDRFDPVVFMVKIMNRKRRHRMLSNCLEMISPETMYEIVKYSNRDTWFARSIYEEMLSRYETISYILNTSGSSPTARRIIEVCLGLRMELRPVNNETLGVTADALRKKLETGKPLNLVSLTCPAYTVGREGIAENLIQNRIEFFLDVASRSMETLKELVSEWHIFAWDPSGLDHPILRKTVHPKLLQSSTLENQLKRSWTLFSRMATMMRETLGIEVVLRRYTELLSDILLAKDVLERLEQRDGFLSSCIERIMRHGREDYARMGEDIEEHRERFWNDSYIYTAAILRYGMTSSPSKDISLMVSIDSRIHHIMGLRLFHFEDGKDTYLMPVWNFPTWIRSFYWVNPGNENVAQGILEAKERWAKYETWLKALR